MSGPQPTPSATTRRVAASRRSGGPRPPSASGGRRIGLGLLIPAILGAALIILPLAGLLLRTDWGQLPGYLTGDAVWPALRLSLITTVTTVVACLILGTPLAWALSRTDGPITRVVRALVTVPVVLPPVVGGVALLLAYGRRGVLGPGLAAFGISLPFTTAAVILAHVFVSLPFFVLAAEGAMRGVDSRLLEIAGTLGASPTRIFTEVALPLAAPGIGAGAALAWARALGEFGATVTFAGSFPGRTQTAPLAIYSALQVDPDAAVALSLVMLLISVTILVLLRGRWVR